MELLIAIIVLGILVAITVNTGISAQRRARETAAITALGDFQGAFTTACINHPGIMKDRENAWKADTGYTTKDGLARLVQYMNESLDAEYAFYWNEEVGCYVSHREDPWGGMYYLTEYPYEDETSDGWDPTTGTGISALRCSIWVTGNDSSIESTETVGSNSIGIGLSYRAGSVSSQYQGLNDSSPFTGLKIITK